MHLGYASAREFFEAVRETARDVEIVQRRLDSYERSAHALPGGIHERVSGTGEADRMAGRVASMVDAEDSLRRRLEDDYNALDLAHVVLYGRDTCDGLASLAPSWWADVMSLFYCERLTWARVASTVAYSEQRCRQVRDASLDLIDAHGLCRVAAGMGMAEA